MARRARPVFINCPFDSDFRPLFRVIVFTVTRCGFVPRCALEVVDGAGTRIAKIERLIEECPLGIHDISRTELDRANGLPRFNMPFELGLFLGARRYGDTRQRRKRCLVLDREEYRYQKFLSDIAGQDISSHQSDLPTLIGVVREFLNSSTQGKPLPSGDAIRKDYDRFQAALPDICRRLELSAAELSFSDFAWVAADYLSQD